MTKQICAPRIFAPTFWVCDLLLAAVMLFSGTPGLAQTNPRNTEKPAAAGMRALNNSVLRLHGQMQRAAPNQIGGLRSQAATVISQRAAALATLIQNDPRAALSFAFSPELLADLAGKFPQSSSSLESHATVTGQVQHWIIDYPKGSRSWWRLDAGGRNLNLFFAGQEPANLKSGQLLQATGVLVGAQMAVETSAPVQSSAVSGLTTNSNQLLGAINLPGGQAWPTSGLMFILGLVFSFPRRQKEIRPWRTPMRSSFKQFAIYGLVFGFVLSSTLGYAQNSCSTKGAQNVAVLLVTFPGVTPPSNITPQNVYDMFFSTTGPSLDGYWREASYGQTFVTGNVFGWYTLDSSYANCGSLTSLRDAAIAAAANSGVAIQTYNRIFIVTTDFGCGWTGLSINGCTSLSSPNGSFTASASFLDASWQRSQAEGAENAAHEGGHGMGLAHAQSRTFGTEPLGPLGTAGTVTEYGDPFSDMSCSNSGHYAAPHKAEILNWLSIGTSYQVVQSSGTWTLQPLEINPVGPVALKVQRGTGNNAWLWVEYRQPIGIYESIWAPSGALVHYEDSTTGAHTQLLDFTPTTSSLYDGALMPGNTWVDPYSNVSITVQSADINGLTLAVNYGATPCTAAAPSVSVSPLNPSIYPGQSAGYTASITNNNSSGCSSTTFNLGSTTPSGWSTSLSATSVTLSPGQTTSVTMSKGAPAGTPAGTYAVDLNAATASSSASGMANATVMTPPSLAVSLSVAGASFTKPGTVSITASVTNGGTAASGANVTFTLTAPNGATSTQTATTGSSGTATWNYKLNAKSPVGTYSVMAQAALTSGTKKNASTTQSATSGSVVFSVQ